MKITEHKRNCPSCNRELFYIDRYDKEKNVVLEYDSKYHKKPYQRQKDLVRQQKL